MRFKHFPFCLAFILFPFLLSASQASEWKDIFEAVEKGTAEDVRFFIEQGADVNAKDKNGKTPLDYVEIARKNVEEKTAILRDAGGKPGNEL